MADVPVGGGSGAVDASDDTKDGAPPIDAAASMACATYCACVTKQCAARSGAPTWVKNAAACPAMCMTFTQQQRTCWSGFCDPKAATISDHECEHAWGGEGLEECK